MTQDDMHRVVAMLKEVVTILESKAKPNHPPQLDAKTMADLQELADYHGLLWGRNTSSRLIVDVHTRRIAKVLEQHGLEACKYILRGHHIRNHDSSIYVSLQFAFPAFKQDGRRNWSEPDWAWIEDYRTLGEKTEHKEQAERASQEHHDQRIRATLREAEQREAVELEEWIKRKGAKP